MRIFFLHNNFPGQYRRIVQQLIGKPGIEMMAASLATNQQKSPITRLGYRRHREPSPKIHPALFSTERAVIQGQAVLKALLPLRQRGWKPDIVLAHTGFGDGLFVKDVWPETRLLSYLEWYYDPQGQEGSFLLGGKDPGPDARIRRRMKNSLILQDLASMDWGQCPTEFQLSQFPRQFRDRITLLHDGVDFEYFSPSQDAELKVGEKTFRRGDPVITYIGRGMEPYRGFPQLMEAISRLQRKRKDVHAVIIGEDRVAYGAKRADGKTYREAALEEWPIDETRVHFVGRQPLSYLRDAFRVAAAHIYLTVPFVLSWSMLEAMSAGALIVGSDTEPVREVVQDGTNGLLVPFFDAQALADKIDYALDNQDKLAPLRTAARALIGERYDARVLGGRQWQLIQDVANGSRN